MHHVSLCPQNSSIKAIFLYRGQIMKKFISALFLLSLTNTYALDEASANALMTKSGCMTCHNQKTTKIGPSYLDVAQRYNNLTPETTAYLNGESPADYLFQKVRTGTKIGKNKNWLVSKEGKKYGMMTPNKESKISDADLKSLISYILTLK